MPAIKKVVHLTSVHHPLDPRIYYKECHSLQNGGYDVTLIAPEVDEQIEHSDVTVIPVKKHKNRIMRMLMTTFSVYKKAKAIKADYYHFHDPELLIVGWLLKKKDNVVIYDIHEDYETSILQKEYVSRRLRTLVAKGYKKIEAFLTNKMELCLAEKYYLDKYPTGTCILNYPILNKELVKNENQKSANNKVIYTGNVTSDRGALIHASLPLLDSNISVHLFGKCPGELAAKMKECAGEGKDRLQIEGIDRYVPKAIIDEQYSSYSWLAGIALFPPTEHYMRKELTKFFEYMTAGLPILCSNFPLWKTFIDTYQCGVTVNPSDEKEIKAAIDYLRNNPDEAKKMGENGRKAVLSELNWGIEEKKLLEWYEQIVQ